MWLHISWHRDSANSKLPWGNDRKQDEIWRAKSTHCWQSHLNVGGLRSNRRRIQNMLMYSVHLSYWMVWSLRSFSKQYYALCFSKSIRKLKNFVKRETVNTHSYKAYMQLKRFLQESNLPNSLRTTKLSRMPHNISAGFHVWAEIKASGLENLKVRQPENICNSMRLVAVFYIWTRW